jgi:hydrogenase expression/formation protein HypE
LPAMNTVTHKAYRTEAVLFDFDGTLTRAGAIDFGEIRRVLGCPPDVLIIEYIRNLADGRTRAEARETLDRYELEAATRSYPNQGAEELVHWIKACGLPVGILTRNSRVSVRRALQNFPTLEERDFDLILTRDDPVAPKPSGEGVDRFAAHFNIDPAQVLMVGDFLLDTQAGQVAGAVTVLLDQGEDPRLEGAQCDFRVQRLDAVKEIVRQGLPLKAGKLPNDMLQTYLRQFHFEDASLLINPGVGEDIAAVDVARSEVLVLKSDPITFATDAIGRYSVLVNANDIATAGARPRWFLTTLLMPCGITPSHVRRIMQELAEVCHRRKIILCGGHTEITDAVRRPVVIGMMAGCVPRKDLIDKKQMAPGDWVLVTKGVAVEGTAIIAREFGDQLRARGMSPEQIAISRRYLDQISIIEEAGLVADKRMATAMHDVTEGGLATALEELSIAGGHRISVEMETIPVLAQTEEICNLFNLDPLGLIGSGSLLICCRPEHGADAMNTVASAGIQVTRIGQVQEPGSGVQAFYKGSPVSWPKFEVDEITKLF